MRQGPSARKFSQTEATPYIATQHLDATIARSKEQKLPTLAKLRVRCHKLST
jgi:hypothetical protein